MTLASSPRARSGIAAVAALGLLAFVGLGTYRATQSPPIGPVPAFVVDNRLFDPTFPATLGLKTLPGVETLAVFRPGETDNKFNHGAVVTEFAGQLYVQWQSSAKDEDSPDTRVVYSSSRDGRSWAEPQPLAEPPPGAMTTSGGWWRHDGKLIAFVNVWPDAGNIKRGGYATYVTSRDGTTWTEPQPVTDASGKQVLGIFEQDPQALPSGRIVSAFHLQPGLQVAPFYTDDPSGTGGWTRGQMENLPEDSLVSRELEPSWFRRADEALVMIFRDQNKTFRKLAAVSQDQGESWTQPALTNMPDARTKQSAGNLPSGAAFLVGNPVKNRSRFPLAIALSKDGQRFTHSWLLRGGGKALPAMRYPGRYKRPGYSYPKSAVLGNWLYVAYATNKEDIELTRVPLSALD